MKRVKSEAIGWHVIARGARRLDLFRDDLDFTTFISMFRYALNVSGAALWAFTLMSNHYHLVLYASSRQLTACMQRLNRSYARYHNRRYGLVGHAFDGPYKAYRQPTPLLLLRTIAYVFMNPVTAGLEQAPEHYRWSCVRDYLNLPGSAMRVHPAEVMARVSQEPEEAWASFHRAMRREAKRPKRMVSDRLTRTQVHAQQFEWLLEHALESVGNLGDEDPVQVALYWARQCGVTPTAMASVLKNHPAEMIRVTLCRFQKKLLADPALARRLALP